MKNHEVCCMELKKLFDTSLLTFPTPRIHKQEFTLGQTRVLLVSCPRPGELIMHVTFTPRRG